MYNYYFVIANSVNLNSILLFMISPLLLITIILFSVLVDIAEVVSLPVAIPPGHTHVHQHCHHTKNPVHQVEIHPTAGVGEP